MIYYKEIEFVNWLSNDTTRWNDCNSINEYKSGVGSVISWINSHKHFWKPKGKTPIYDFEDYLKDIDNQDSRDTFFSAILNIIQKGINSNVQNKSTLQNYKSYISAFEEFFKNMPFTGKGITIAQLQLLRYNASNSTYTASELVGEFMGRILTQDRVSNAKKILFPIRLIRKLWSNETESWAQGVCENIWLILKNETTGIVLEKRIKDITTLIIRRSGRVSVIYKGDEYCLYTSYSDPYERLCVESSKISYLRKRSQKILSCKFPVGGFTLDKNQNIIDSQTGNTLLWHIKPMKVRTIGDIAIDHDIPIALILTENEKKLTNLESFSDIYRILAGNYGLKISASDINNMCTNITKYSNDEILLKNSCKNQFPNADMNIIGKCRLVLMGKKENTIKSDN